MSKVVILGAGASAGYENSEIGLRAPTANDFLQKARQLILDGHMNADLFRNLISFLCKYYNLHESRWLTSNINIEEVLTILDLDTGKFSMAREELIKLIYLTLDKILYGDPCPHHKVIIEQFDESDTIINFNWDLLVDNIISLSSSQNQRPDYCRDFEKIFLNEHWHDSMAISSGPKLLKMHGSLNWMYCNNCKSTYAYILSGKTGAEQIQDPHNERLKCQKCNGFKMEPVIIPPSLGKPYDKWPAIDSIWIEAANALKGAEEVAVIGYSLPVTDFKAKWLFLESVAKRTSPLRKLTVVDKYPNGLFEKYKEIFRVSDKKFEGIQGEISCLSNIASV